MNTFFNNIQIFSPLDQFEIRNLLSIDLPVLGNLQFSLTNIGLYLIIGTIFIILLGLLSTNYNKLVGDNWSLGIETIYDTVLSVVTNQINARSGQAYFPFIFGLFVFILINNLIGLVNRCLSFFIIKFIFVSYGRFAQNLIRLYSSVTTTSGSTLKYSFNNKNSFFFIHTL